MNMRYVRGVIQCGAGLFVACVMMAATTPSVFAYAGDLCNKQGGSCKLMDDKYTCADYGLQGSGPVDCPVNNPPGTYMACCVGGVKQVEAATSTPPEKISVAKSYGYQPPLGNLSIPSLIARIIERALPVIGALFFVMFVWGGSLWLLAGGDEGKVKKARQTLVNAAIGLAIVMGAYAIVYNIMQALGTAIGQ